MRTFLIATAITTLIYGPVHAENMNSGDGMKAGMSGPMNSNAEMMRHHKMKHHMMKHHVMKKKMDDGMMSDKKM